MASGKKYDMREALNTFFLESGEMLENMEASLLDLEKNKQNRESIGTLFRAVHTIKGSSGMFGFAEIESFTHVVENLLSEVRKETIQIDSGMIGVLLESHDYMGRLIDIYRENKDAVPGKELLDIKNGLLARLADYSGRVGKASSGKGAVPAAGDVAPGGAMSAEDIQVRNVCWHISLRFGKDVFRNALDPRSFISYLKGMGEIVSIKTVYDALPDTDAMDPESCYLGFEIDFRGDTTREKLLNVFDFVKDDCRINILPPNSYISEYVKLIHDLPESQMKIGDILLEIGTLTREELDRALQIQEQLQRKLLGEIIMEESMVPRQVMDAALEKQVKVNSSSIRISSQKLDKLINLIGELVITEAGVRQISDGVEHQGLSESVNRMTGLIEEIRDSTINLRMVQIGDIFNRFERVVRDLSREKAKNIDLVISGGETELDRSLIEKISDPLMHLVRNSIDHGIEPMEERIARGKSARGKIFLNAYHETGTVVIEVIDDGSGLDRAKILKKGLAMGLVRQERAQGISDTELFQLIFEPGFSTAEKVTNVSGRGVGMDVVKRNVEMLRGSIVIESKEGLGTTVRIHLPLTLAIIDGFLIQVGRATYVIPLDMISECIDADSLALDSKSSVNYVDIRGEVVPYLRMRDFFNIRDGSVRRENLIILKYGRKRVGIVVDRSVGKYQTVIKPLNRIFSTVQWLSGATILGNGEVALILDVTKLIQLIESLQQKSPDADAVR